METCQCGCGAQFAGKNAKAAYDQHQIDVHGNEPDALQKKVAELETENASLKSQLAEMTAKVAELSAKLG
jgi:predicted RNase H-like nuclease (RuvC/YqgF family)